MTTKDKEISNLKYIRDKLDSFLKTYLDNKNTITLRDQETRDNLIGLIKEINETLNEVLEDNDPSYELKLEFVNILNDLKSEIEFNKSLDKPIKTDIKIYNEKAYSKLNYLFRKQKIMGNDQARNLYENNFDYLYDKYIVFLDLINWLNDNGLSIIPEKTLFSAYLGISIETYNDILKYASDNEVRNLFKSIDEYFTTNQFGALINNDRKSLERIQKTETYGQEMRQTQIDNMIVNNTMNLSYYELMQKLEKKKTNILDYKEK